MRAERRYAELKAKGEDVSGTDNRGSEKGL
jgi:hypothetical protein